MSGLKRFFTGSLACGFSFFSSRQVLRSRPRLDMEALEPRWTPAWSGVPPLAIAPPAATTVAFNSSGDAVGTASISSTEVDYYSILAPRGGTYRFSATTPSSSLDPVMGLFSAGGQRLAYNDDVSQADTDSRFSVSLTAGSRYFVGITNYSGTRSGSYTWTFDGPEALSGDDAYEENDGFAAARDLGAVSGSRSLAGLVMNDAADWFAFRTTAVGTTNSSVAIAFTHASGDLDLRLYDSAGNGIGLSEGTSNSERLSLNGRAAGTYYVKVYGYEDAKNPSYSLTLSAPSGTTSGVDLVGASLTVDASGVLGRPIDVQAAVRNNGNVASGAFSVEWWLSTDNVRSADDIILTDLNKVGFRTFSGLAAGATSNTLNVTLSLPPSLPAGWDASRLFVVMRTDAGNAVAESNETNNGGQIGLGRDSASISITDGVAGDFEITLNISGMTTAQRAIFQSAADRWAEVIVGDLPDATYNGIRVDDVRIDARASAIDGVGGVLGQAGPDRFRSGSQLPIHGVMEFDAADLADMQADGSLFDVILHEMGHVLGIGTIWETLGLLRGAGTSNPTFTGPRATAAYNTLFGLNSAGVPVENGGGPGTRDGHFRESTFGNELMTGYIDFGLNPLSRITVASLADLGYQVNMAAADSFTRSSSLAASSSFATSSGLPGVIASLESASERRHRLWDAALTHLFSRDC